MTAPVAGKASRQAEAISLIRTFLRCLSDFSSSSHRAAEEGGGVNLVDGVMMFPKPSDLNPQPFSILDPKP